MRSIFGQSLLQAAIYIALSVSRASLVTRVGESSTEYAQIGFAGSSAVLVMTYAP